MVSRELHSSSNYTSFVHHQLCESDISVHKNLSEFSGIMNICLTSFWFQLSAVPDISLSLISFIFVSAVPRWRIHWWLPTYQVHSCHLYSLLWLFWDTTVYSRRATASKPLWKLCRTVAVRWEMLYFCLSFVWTNPTGRQIPCIVLSCLSMPEERWDCLILRKYLGFISHHICATHWA